MSMERHTLRAVKLTQNIFALRLIIVYIPGTLLKKFNHNGEFTMKKSLINII